MRLQRQARVSNGRQREGRRGTGGGGAGEEKDGSHGRLVGVGDGKTLGDFPLQRNDNRSHF